MSRASTAPVSLAGVSACHKRPPRQSRPGAVSACHERPPRPSLARGRFRPVTSVPRTRLARGRFPLVTSVHRASLARGRFPNVTSVHRASLARGRFRPVTSVPRARLARRRFRPLMRVPRARLARGRFRPVTSVPRARLARGRLITSVPRARLARGRFRPVTSVHRASLARGRFPPVTSMSRASPARGRFPRVTRPSPQPASYARSAPPASVARPVCSTTKWKSLLISVVTACIAPRHLKRKPKAEPKHQRCFWEKETVKKGNRGTLRPPCLGEPCPKMGNRAPRWGAKRKATGARASRRPPPPCPAVSTAVPNPPPGHGVCGGFRERSIPGKNRATDSLS